MTTPSVPSRVAEPSSSTTSPARKTIPLPRVAVDALYFESPTPAPNDAPRLLLISFTFPPDPAVGGVRWQEMARYFTARGWAVDVIAHEFSKVPHLDRQRLERLPEGVRIFTVSSTEPLFSRAQKVVWPALRKLIGKRDSSTAHSLSPQEIMREEGGRRIIRAYLAWADFSSAEKWARAAARLATQVLRASRYVAVVSSGPPHMAHEAGRLASMRTNVPHVIDMRDPWSLLQRLSEPIASPTWFRLAHRYEERAVEHASLITMNTDASCRAMRQVYADSADKIEVIRNGCDDDPHPPARRDGKFRVRFAGSIYMDRDPRLVFRAARRVITLLGLTPDQFRFEFIGLALSYAGTPTLQIAKEEGLEGYVKVGGRLTRKEAMEFIGGATVLLSLPQDSNFAVPAKIYEYMQCDSWMLVIASPESATALLLHDTAADVADPKNVEEIARILQTRYEQFVAGVRPERVNRDGRFDRTHQAQKLMDLIVQRCGVSVP